MFTVTFYLVSLLKFGLYVFIIKIFSDSHARVIFGHDKC